MVRWLINGRVKDEEYENNAGDVIENRYDNFLVDTPPHIYMLYKCQKEHFSHNYPCHMD